MAIEYDSNPPSLGPLMTIEVHNAPRNKEQTSGSIVRVDNLTVVVLNKAI